MAEHLQFSGLPQFVDDGNTIEGASQALVYVDAAVWPYGRMVMCHMFAQNLDELHAMADRIGVSRRWFQNKPGFPHYDICKAKRTLAVGFGAVEVDRKKFVELVRSFRVLRVSNS